MSEMVGFVSSGSEIGRRFVLISDSLRSLEWVCERLFGAIIDFLRVVSAWRRYTIMFVSFLFGTGLEGHCRLVLRQLWVVLASTRRLLS